LPTRKSILENSSKDTVSSSTVPTSCEFTWEKEVLPYLLYACHFSAYNQVECHYEQAS